MSQLWLVAFSTFSACGAGSGGEGAGSGGFVLFVCLVLNDASTLVGH